MCIRVGVTVGYGRVYCCVSELITGGARGINEASGQTWGQLDGGIGAAMGAA